MKENIKKQGVQNWDDFGAALSADLERTSVRFPKPLLVAVKRIAKSRNETFNGLMQKIAIDFLKSERQAAK